MKKNPYLLRTVIIICCLITIIVSGFIAGRPSHEEKVARMLADKNDSITMTAFLSGKYPELKEAAEEIAHYNLYLGRPDQMIMAIKILEQKNTPEKELVESIINSIEYEYSICMPEDNENYLEWIAAMDKIKSELNSSLLKAVSDSAINQNYDPILKSYFSSKSLVSKEILNHKNFGKKDFIRIMTYSILVDQTKQKEILAMIPDEILAISYTYSMNDYVEYERRIKLAKLADFFFLEEFGLSLGDQDEIFFDQIGILSTETIMEFLSKRSVDYIKYDETIENELSKRKTKCLVSFLEKDGKKIAWEQNFPYTKYALIVISSVNDKEDFERALNFFINVTHNGDEEKMLGILTASKSSLL